MSTVYTPSAVIMPATITLPQDLVDQRSAASVNVPFQTLADAIAYLGQSISVVRSFACADGMSRGSTAMAKTHDIRTTSFWYPTNGDSAAADAARAWMYSEYRYMKFPNADNASAIGRHLLFPLNQYLSQGATLSSVKLILAGTGHGALPAMMPSLAVIRYKPEDDSLVSLLAANTLDDASASAAAYDAIHSITLACDQNTTVDMDACSYYAVVCNEGHTDALAELRLYNMILTMSVPRYQR